ncbi:hypothetical protein NC651_037850 [Populus alba x Populus x berolinensis]|nr:hypothetical protein NC651_037850 [Populus alba x Populus x berolinensis]
MVLGAFLMRAKDLKRLKFLTGSGD